MRTCLITDLLSSVILGIGSVCLNNVLVTDLSYGSASLLWLLRLVYDYHMTVPKVLRELSDLLVELDVKEEFVGSIAHSADARLPA